MSDIDWSKMTFASMWRDWIVKSEAQWSEAVSSMMKDARAGGMLTKQVDEARMMQRMFGEMAQTSLAAANLPSRSDLEALDERMGKLEDGLAQVSAELARLRNALGASAKLPTPPRNRKPPAKPSTLNPATPKSALKRAKSRP